MKKSSVSRRKFLSGMGVAAGAAALAPTIKTFGAGPKSRGGLLNAWTRPFMSNDSDTLRPVRILNRKPGSHLQPLTKRPF